MSKTVKCACPPPPLGRRRRECLAVSHPPARCRRPTRKSGNAFLTAPAERGLIFRAHEFGVGAQDTPARGPATESERPRSFSCRTRKLRREVLPRRCALPA